MDDLKEDAFDLADAMIARGVLAGAFHHVVTRYSVDDFSKQWFDLTPAEQRSYINLARTLRRVFDSSSARKTASNP